MNLFSRLRRASTPAAPAATALTPLSRFGGFWTDTVERQAELHALVGRGEITPEDERRLQFWIEHGFAVIPEVLDSAEVSRLQHAIDRIIDTGARQMTFWDHAGKHQCHARRDKLAAAECKVIDVHASATEVQAAVFAPKLARFFELVMRAKAIAFQTLYFEYGSEQPVHQDTAFVHVDPPLDFLASWIALEDIGKGTGELMYYPGSHRLPDVLFGQPPGKALPAGDPASETYSAKLAQRCEAAGLALETFLPKRGDALIWAADLVHGGSPRRVQRSRRSLVTHYCPAHRRPPYARHTAAVPTPLANGHFLLSQT